VNVENLGLSLGDLASISLSDYYMLQNNYDGALTARYYMPIATSKRIAMFGEVGLGAEYGQSVTCNVKDGHNYGTFQNIMVLDLMSYLDSAFLQLIISALRLLLEY
jgi:hypothetical protein